MECLHPIKIINPTKYVSRYRRDRYVNYVPCGQCPVCQQRISNEWYYRTMQEFKYAMEIPDSYCLFDTLTYAPKHVNYISNFVEIPHSLDHMCFNYEDFRLFMVRLRRRLSYDGYDVENCLRYFACTEYGGNYTHRPHIHVLFFVIAGKIPALELSKYISLCWYQGRTDGIPYKSTTYVVRHNVLSSQDKVNSMRVCKYVSKYVQKSCKFQSELNFRFERVMEYLYYNGDNTDGYEEWRNSIAGKKMARRLKSHIDQFHRQSLGFGASVLRDIDVNEVMQTNVLSVPDSEKIVMRISLPTYYKRKLFYEQIECDGMKYWQPTELGVQYLRIRDEYNMNRLVQSYQLASYNYNLNIDNCKELADYVLHYRGCVIADKSSIRLQEKIQEPCLYNYVTWCDREFLGGSFISDEFCGNQNIYYKIAGCQIDINEFIKKYVYFNAEYENMLDELQKKKLITDSKCVDSIELRQNLNQFYKSLDESYRARD